MVFLKVYFKDTDDEPERRAKRKGNFASIEHRSRPELMNERQRESFFSLVLRLRYTEAALVKKT